MQIIVDSPIQQTLIFGIIFFIFLAVSIRLKKSKELFSFELTNELKGLAILIVVFSHIGYFLSKDTRFLFPFSAFAGVGVDMFLLLSGYGLTISYITKRISPWQFYYKRIVKMFIPLWITLIILIIIDKLFLGISYSTVTLLKNFLGFFPRADLFRDIDSPLWFITLITFYYLIFPLLFVKKWPFVSAIFYFFAGYLITKYALIPLDLGTLWLHKLHILAFPVGVFIGAIFHRFKLNNYPTLSFRPKQSEVDRASLPAMAMEQKSPSQKRKTSIITFVILTILSLVFLFISYYLGLHSSIGQGQWPEQNKSVLIVITVITAFMLLPFEFKFLNLLGIYSFEIYMLHWPIMYRYDFLYKFLPAGLATMLYLLIFIGLGYFLQILTKFILRPKKT